MFWKAEYLLFAMSFNLFEVAYKNARLDAISEPLQKAQLFFTLWLQTALRCLNFKTRLTYPTNSLQTAPVKMLVLSEYVASLLVGSKCPHYLRHIGGGRVFRHKRSGWLAIHIFALLKAAPFSLRVGNINQGFLRIVWSWLFITIHWLRYIDKQLRRGESLHCDSMFFALLHNGDFRLVEFDRMSLFSQR